MERFLIGYLNRNLPEYEKTIESLSAQIAYNSLDENEKIEYAIFSQSLEPLFFNLSRKELRMIEENLPPFSKIIQQIFKKLKIEEEEAEILRKKIPFYKLFTEEGRELRKRKKEIYKKILNEEWEKISNVYKKKLWMDFQKLLIPLYVTGVLETYFATSNPYLIAYGLLVFSMPYYLLRYASYELTNKRISQYLSRLATIYFIGRNPTGFLQSMIEFGVLAPKIGELVERAWPYLPKKARKIIDRTEKFLSNVKPKKFDKKEIAERLYEVPKFLDTSIPNYVLEKYRENIESGKIEVENPRETLAKPYVLGYHRRAIVVQDRKIVDKDYVRKLAKIEGINLEKMEEEILKRPEKYLGIDMKNGKLVYVKDIIGIVPSKKEGLYEGVIRKEGYLCMLALKSDEIAKLLWSLQPVEVSIEEFLTKYVIK